MDTATVEMVCGWVDGQYKRYATLEERVEAVARYMRDELRIGGLAQNRAIVNQALNLRMRQNLEVTTSQPRETEQWQWKMFDPCKEGACHECAEYTYDPKVTNRCACDCHQSQECRDRICGHPECC